MAFYIATEGGLQDSNNDVSVEFYVDDSNVVTGTPSSGDVTVPASTFPVTLANEVGGLDTFVDGSVGNNGSSTDYSISSEGTPDTTPDDDASAVELAPGESVTISIYIEIDTSISSDQSVIDEIVFVASENISGDLQDVS